MVKKKKRQLIFDEKGLTAFAERLRHVRKDRGFTQEKLSGASGIELSQIARIETVRINPTLSTIFKLARAMKVPLSELFDFKLPKE